MSCHALAWAFAQKTEAPVDKLLLIYLANNAGVDGGVTFTSRADIAELQRFAGLDKFATKAAIDRLIDHELIRRVDKEWWQIACDERAATGFADLGAWELCS